MNIKKLYEICKVIIVLCVTVCAVIFTASVVIFGNICIRIY